MPSSQNSKRKFAELTLLFGVPLITEATQNSRLGGLQRRLQKVVTPDLKLIKNMTETDIRAIDTLIVTWLKDIKWWANPTHLGALISFCLDMVEGSPIVYNPKITETLNLIAEHLENGQNLLYPSLEEATAIAKYWQAIYTQESYEKETPHPQPAL
jgi:hypothetical protein